MSNLFKSKSTSSSKTTANKATQALFDPAYQNMQSLINRPFTPYDGQLSAGMNATQQQARGLLDVNAGQGATNAAAQGAYGLLNREAPVVTPANMQAQGYRYDPMTAANAGQTNNVTSQGYQPITGQAVQAGPAAMARAASVDRGAVRDVSADTIASGMGLYRNPYEDQVVQNSLDDLNLQRQRSINNQAGGFTQAGAFGGSRQGVADSLTNEAYLRESGSLAAQMRAQGFNTAADLSGRDVGNRMQASLANQGADMSIAGQNAGFTQQANLTNAGAQNSRDQFNAGLLQQTGLANMDAGNRASEFGASAFNQAAGQNAAAANSRQEFNAGLLQNAGQFNAGQMADAARFGADAGNNANQANAGFAQQAALANAGNYLQNNSQNLQAAGLLGNLGQQQQGMNIDAVNALNTLGTQEQSMNQADLDRLYQQYLLQQDYGQRQISNTAGLLGTIPTLYAGASQKGTQTQSPSVASIFGSGLQLASSLFPPK
jgi:hypothetical protein